MQSEISERRKQKDRGKNHDRHKNISRRNRRTDSSRKRGGYDRDGDRNNPARKRALAKAVFFRVDPGKKLWDEKNRAERNVDDENKIPRGARPFQRRPNHRAEIGDEIKKDVTRNSDGIDRGQRGKRWRFPLSPLRDYACEQ